jgi:hypothetical protein
VRVDTTPEAFFEGHPVGLAAYHRVVGCLAEVGSLTVRVSRTQVAFRRRRGFAYLWLPERTLGARAAGIVVLSFALGRHEPSARIKEVVQVSSRHWMHHLELRDPTELDAEAAAWLLEAADRAG